jgi:hypothetical protein
MGRNGGSRRRGPSLANSANPLKEWPVGYHADLLRGCWREHPALKVVATASPNEREQGGCDSFRRRTIPGWFACRTG